MFRHKLREMLLKLGNVKTEYDYLLEILTKPVHKHVQEKHSFTGTALPEDPQTKITFEWLA